MTQTTMMASLLQKVIGTCSMKGTLLQQVYEAFSSTCNKVSWQTTNAYIEQRCLD